MVYVHGGGFFSGSTDPAIVGPRYLMNTGDVILVNMQYRLSTLGFLSTADSASPGNFGLKDQALALSWVKNHISAFGGDPSQITLFGQSAGGASVHMHTMSPLSRGLFSQVIPMSGNGINPWNTPTSDPLALARRHAQVLNVPNALTLSTDQLVARLREIPASDLISSVTHLKFFDVDSLTVYRTVVEPDLLGAFLTDTPWNLVRTGNYAKLPMMLGLVQQEGAVRAAAIIVNENLTASMNEQMLDLLPNLMELELSGEERVEFTKKMLGRFLPKTHQLTTVNEASFMRVRSDLEIMREYLQFFLFHSQLYNERSFEYPHYKLLKTMAKVSPLQNVYTYYFDYRGQYSYSLLFTNTFRDFGVVHCDDLIYLFESPLLFPQGLNAEDTVMSSRLVQHYVKFARGEAPWRRTTDQGSRIGPYNSLANDQKKYYTDFGMVHFWDQTRELENV